ncbi:hypothetical protein DSTSK_35800 [Desulforhabdus sp. TSK]|nr:hypothetical protein DSTSK_35800 [Desulforhabdus sp. TSK]
MREKEVISEVLLRDKGGKSQCIAARISTDSG